MAETQHPTTRYRIRRGDRPALLSDTERAVLLTSLILALDEVESTLGHFASYLNNWSPRSYNKLHCKCRVCCRGLELMPFTGATSSTVASASRRTSPISTRLTARTTRRCPLAGSLCRLLPSVDNRLPERQATCLEKPKRRADTSDTVADSPFEEFRRSESGHFIAVEAIERFLRASPRKTHHFILQFGRRATARN